MPALPSVSASGAMAGGSLGATPVANQTRLPSDTQRVLYDDKTIASSQEILDAAAMPVVAGQVPSANRKLASSASCESLTNSSKDIQTITRAELDGFLLAAFLALVRKMYGGVRMR